MMVKFILGLGIFMMGCEDKYYSDDRIQVVSQDASENGSIRLTIKPPLESLYYAGGYEVVDSDGARQLRIVRCVVGKHCQAEVPFAEPGRDEQTIVLVKRVGEKVLWKGQEL